MTPCTTSPASPGSARRRSAPGRPVRSSGLGWQAGSLVEGPGLGSGPAEAAQLHWAERADGGMRKVGTEEECWEAVMQLPLPDCKEKSIINA